MSLSVERRCSHSGAPRSEEYERTVQTLNLLQKNGPDKQQGQRHSKQKIPQTEKFLKRVGIEIEELNRLNIIHVSGTKGKGSTTSFCESILRHHGYRTGFYSSPHLVEARERIRINGQPVTQEMFSFYFWKVYNNLWEKQEYEKDMPGYFQFLTIMAFYLFLEESVDVAIIEVGIGGEYDCTNVIRNPLVCGVTSLGHDHLKMLGNSLDKIAWHKAGIFKCGAPALTVCQPPEAMRVLVQRAMEKQISLYEVPALNECIDGFSSQIQYINAALAVQLAQAWIDIQTKGIFQPTESGSDSICSSLPLSFPVSTVTQKTVKGLHSCFWPGRTQVLRKESVTYFLDGAHTIESIQACVEWFKKASKEEQARVNGNIFKVLVFNLTKDRAPEDFITPLADCQFDLVIFCPNFAHVSTSGCSDQFAVASTWEMQMERCTHNSNVWQKFTTSTSSRRSVLHISENYSSLVPGEGCRTTSRTAVFPSICDVLKWLSQNHDSKPPTPSIDTLPSDQLAAAEQVQVLVTGSLLLVGDFLGLLDPELSGASSDNVDRKSKLFVSENQHILNSIHTDMSTCCVPGTP